MGQQQQPQSPGESSNSNDLMFILIFFIGVLCVLWLVKDYYFPYIFKIKYYELIFANYFVQVDPQVFTSVIEAEYRPDILTPNDFFLILNQVGDYYKYAVAGLLSILALFIFIRSPRNKFSKTFSMKSFRQQEKINWPQIIPPGKIDLIEKDIAEGPWASALTPIQFAKKHKLLDIIVNPNPNPLLNELPKTAKLKEVKARQVFASQLGYVWQGPEQLPIHQKALFVIFAAVINNDRPIADKLIRQFNTSLEFSSSPDFSQVEELVQKYKNTKLIKKAESRHAYVLTVMAALLELARADGVLACADFLWLKTIDRPLWYMLNNVGRRASYPEVAGAMAHWRIESRMQKKLLSPMIEEAVKALKIGLEEIIYTDEDD